MRWVLICGAAAFCVACGTGAPVDLLKSSAGTSAGQGTTTGTGSGSTSGGITGSSTAGSSSGSTSSATGGSTGGVGTTGAPPARCASNYFACPAGTAKAGQYLPGAAPADCGGSPGQTLPNALLMGGAVLNFSTTEVADSTDPATWAPSMSMLDLYCSGFRYVWIDVSTGWCSRSKQQAQAIVGWTGQGYSSDSLVQKWLNAGGLVLSVLEEGKTNLMLATTDDLSYWIGYYRVPYPMSIDTTQNLDGLFSVAAWPTNVIVDLSNMQVVKVLVDYDQANLQAYCDVLGITGPCSP
jgi:hypothetical protein